MDGMRSIGMPVLILLFAIGLIVGARFGGWGGGMSSPRDRGGPF